MIPSHRSADHPRPADTVGDAVPGRNLDRPPRRTRRRPGPRTCTPFIAGLPKAELHVHHVGSPPPVSLGTGRPPPDSKVPTDPEALVDYFSFTDFAHFIDVYLSVAISSARRRTYDC